MNIGGELLGELIGDPVVIVGYDKAWSWRFLEFERRLRDVLGPVASRFDHIGSTAVPGLPANPFIDVQ